MSLRREPDEDREPDDDSDVDARALRKALATLEALRRKLTRLSERRTERDRACFFDLDPDDLP